MTAVKQSPEDTVTGEFRDQKTPLLKVFEELETDRESSSDDMENYSPKSVVSKVRKWPAAVKDVRRCVHSQIVRIREEDSHLGEDIGECLIARVSGAGHDVVDFVFSSRPSSPLSGRGAARIDIVQ